MRGARGQLAGFSGEVVFGVWLKADGQETPDGAECCKAVSEGPCLHGSGDSLCVGVTPGLLPAPSGPAGSQTSSSPCAGRGDGAAGLAASAPAVGPDVAPGGSF